MVRSTSGAHREEKRKPLRTLLNDTTPPSPSRKSFFSVVVDDILVRGSEVEVNKFYDHLKVRFECQEPSFLTLNSKITYCGLDITLRSIEGKGGSRGTCIPLISR